jgi:hypothetical protein
LDKFFFENLLVQHLKNVGSGMIIKMLTTLLVKNVSPAFPEKNVDQHLKTVEMTVGDSPEGP